VSNPKQEVIRYRLQSAREALDDAEFNLAAGRLRVASNRVYYSMFYAAIALLATRDLSTARHSGAITLFHDNFVRTGAFPKELARNLGRAFDLRADSDYSDFAALDAKGLREMLANARDFVSKAEEIAEGL
jgi:uncharacterized protein (UPF0332 family)